MIEPPSLRDAIGSYLFVEHNLDDEFAANLASGRSRFDEQLRRGLARVLATGAMDFDDFTEITGDFEDEDDEIIERLQHIWETAFPGVDVREYLGSSGATAAE